MFKPNGGGSKAFWTMLKKIALFLSGGFPNCGGRAFTLTIQVEKCSCLGVLLKGRPFFSQSQSPKILLFECQAQIFQTNWNTRKCCCCCGPRWGCCVLTQNLYYWWTMSVTKSVFFVWIELKTLLTNLKMKMPLLVCVSVFVVVWTLSRAFLHSSIHPDAHSIRGHSHSTILYYHILHKNITPVLEQHCAGVLY